MAERGIAVSYETVRLWVNHFGSRIAAELRKGRSKPHTTWHLDEVYLKIDGHLVYLWRAVDAEGEMLDVLVQTRGAKRSRGLSFAPVPAVAPDLYLDPALGSAARPGACFSGWDARTGPKAERG